MLDCNYVEKITDVTDQIDYEDTYGGGRGDSKWVSCGQDGDYNELENKFLEHFDRITKESWMAKLMCGCCKKLKPKGTEKVVWSKFYKCILSSVPRDKEKTFRKLNDLIKWHEAKER